MNNTGKKYGGRKKGTPNKITTLVKENISKYITDCLNSIDIDSLEDSDKIRLALGMMHYVIPKRKAEEVKPVEPRRIEMVIVDSIGREYNEVTKKFEDIKPAMEKLDDNDYELDNLLNMIYWILRIN